MHRCATPPQANEKAEPTKRKKEGAFYTPEFVTRYIVTETLGPVLRDRFESHRLQAETSVPKKVKGLKALLSHPATFDVNELTKPHVTLVVDNVSTAAQQDVIGVEDRDISRGTVWSENGRVAALRACSFALARYAAKSAVDAFGSVEGGAETGSQAMTEESLFQTGLANLARSGLTLRRLFLSVADR